MSSRFFVPRIVLGLFGFALLLAPRSSDAQAPKRYVAPRTANGQPDLQGFWSNTTYTPLQRPDNVTKPLYTREEAEQAARKAAVEEGEQTLPGTIPDVHYDFTQFGLDRSQSPFVLN